MIMSPNVTSVCRQQLQLMRSECDRKLRRRGAFLRRNNTTRKVIGPFTNTMTRATVIGGNGAHVE